MPTESAVKQSLTILGESFLAAADTTEQTKIKQEIIDVILRSSYTYNRYEMVKQWVVTFNRDLDRYIRHEENLYFAAQSLESLIDLIDLSELEDDNTNTKQ